MIKTNKIIVDFRDGKLAIGSVGNQLGLFQLYKKGKANEKVSNDEVDITSPEVVMIFKNANQIKILESFLKKIKNHLKGEK